MADDVLVINDYAKLQRRLTTSGKERYSIRISGESVIMNAEPKSLGKPLAEAIAAHLRDRVESIGTGAAPNTIRARATAKRAVDRGMPWATRRYAGGRIGAMEPAQSTALFNDSGRLAKSIVAGATSSSWVVNVAANRFSPETLDHGGSAALAGIIAKLKGLIPEFGDAAQLGDVLSVRRALNEAIADRLKKSRQEEAENLVRLLEMGIQAFSAAFG